MKEISDSKHDSKELEKLEATIKENVGFLIASVIWVLAVLAFSGAFTGAFTSTDCQYAGCGDSATGASAILCSVPIFGMLAIYKVYQLIPEVMLWFRLKRENESTN